MCHCGNVLLGIALEDVTGHLLSREWVAEPFGGCSTSVMVKASQDRTVFPRLVENCCSVIPAG